MKKKDMKFGTIDSLQSVINVINEAGMALEDSTRTIANSAISEVLGGALGAGVGGVISFTALYGLGTVGLAATGITSGLAAAGGAVSGLVGGALSPMVAGVFVLAAPVAALAAGGVGITAAIRKKHLSQEKERLYQEALRKHNAILDTLRKESDSDKERLDYLQSLNILLQKAVEDLAHDLGCA